MEGDLGYLPFGEGEIVVKDVKLKKGMRRDEVNRLLKENDVDLELVDEIYGGNNFNHKWKCECGNIIEKRTWTTVKDKGALRCNKCKYSIIKEKHKIEVEKDSDYEYIDSYFKGDILENGKKSRTVCIKIKHKYCKSIYVVSANAFINMKQRCPKCCGSYENSFAHYIEKELGEPIEKYWDFEKNKVSPYNIWKNPNSKNSEKEDIRVWIKCIKKDYHESYLISCTDFVKGNRCPYCRGFKISPKDSFAKYHIDNTDKDFLIKYWDYNKNKINPYKLMPSNKTKIWIICQEKKYHGSYTISCDHFKIGERCPYCSGKKVNFKDSFGYNYFDMAQSWSLSNSISPFKVMQSSGKKYKFICPKCGNEFSRRLADVGEKGCICPKCSKSKGEKRVEQYLINNNIKYKDEVKFKSLVSNLGNPLRYDFYLMDYNILIEYDGEFHFKEYFEGQKFNKNLLHDKMKNDYAKEKNIKLIRIPYWDFDNIEEILDREIRSLL
ncbi:hypothetical protein C4207_01270 [Clostridioides difficile]|uniref:zinc-ribbon domain-containing protein n=1 Tax=Clostridioides difficile TaxID=1496 RepID=UPI001025E86E|nr:zinc-ribbon domain-containing protein [Clostridioides difficile]MDB2927055.1 hypothetical protein [Clostridioides difficile]MDB3110136.1 hypothetical protein [Clostridioides difficile]MDB3458825.1 hypothetical protein [Clostridioides difficile]MDB3485436.1 hypothetical protein [Clostridioides difficile]MDB3489764.1 hypothetical protein [Clostridioides difficile]